MKGVRFCRGCGFTTTHPEPRECPACQDGEGGRPLWHLDTYVGSHCQLPSSYEALRMLGNVLAVVAARVDRLDTERAQVVSALSLEDEVGAEPTIADILDRISVIQADGLDE